MINGCNNRPRPVANKPLQVQDGYVLGMFTYEAGHTDRIDRMVTVPYVMSTDCQYGASATDPGCAGCTHAPHLRHLAAPEAATTATCQPSRLTGQPGATICQPAATTASASTVTAVRNELFPGPSIGDVLAAKDAEIAELRAALSHALLPDQETGQ